eukprot:sb/3471743/
MDISKHAIDQLCLYNVGANAVQRFERHTRELHPRATPRKKLARLGHETSYLDYFIPSFKVPGGFGALAPREVSCKPGGIISGLLYTRSRVHGLKPKLPVREPIRGLDFEIKASDWLAHPKMTKIEGSQAQTSRQDRKPILVALGSSRKGDSEKLYAIGGCSFWIFTSVGLHPEKSWQD